MGRRTTRTLGVAVVVALAAAASASAGEAATRHCGTMAGPGARFSVSEHGANCRVARRVFRELFAGRGKSRRDPSTGALDTVVDGWLCGGGASGFGCSKLGAGGRILPFSPRSPHIEANAPARAGNVGRTATTSPPFRSCRPDVGFDITVSAAPCRVGRRVVADSFVKTKLIPGTHGLGFTVDGYRCRVTQRGSENKPIPSRYRCQHGHVVVTWAYHP
jgi:hypothetical protein